MNVNLRRILQNRYILALNGRTAQVINNNNFDKNSRNFSIESNSYLKAFSKLSHSIANSSVVELTKNNLINIHELTNISWTLEIGLITIIFRTFITFPLSIFQHKILAKFQSLSPELQLHAKKLRKAVGDEKYFFNYTDFKAKLRFNYLLKQEEKRLIIRDNCHPIKGSIVVLFQIPFWIILSHSMRNMAFMKPIAHQKALDIYVFNQLSNEGILWFTNLTQSDPYFILPILVGIVNLAIIQIHSNERLKKLETKTRMHSIITNTLRVTTLLIIPIGFFMPSSVCFYWLMSSTMGLIQTIILYNNRFRQLAGIQIRTQLPINKS